MTRTWRGLEIKTIAEHWRAMRAIPRVPYGWRWIHDAWAPNGLYLPAPWVAEELPELGAPELNPWLEMFRHRTSWPERMLRTWFSAFMVFGVLAFVAMRVYIRSSVSSPLFLLLFGPAIVLLLIVGIRAVSRSAGAIPVSAHGMIFTINKTFQFDFAMLPICARDVKIADLVRMLHRTTRGTRQFQCLVWIIIYVTLPVAAILARGGFQRGFVLALVVVALADLLGEMNRGTFVLRIGMGMHRLFWNMYAIDLAKRMRKARPYPGIFVFLFGRIRSRLRRFVRSFRRSRYSWAMLPTYLLELLIVAVGIAVFIFTLFAPDTWPLAMIYAISCFALARSPLAGRMQAVQRYVLRMNIAEFDFLYRAQRRQTIKRLDGAPATAAFPLSAGR